ncbi:hypothetical protein QQS21_011039 [Conoideocrella luteorostrata]|uniref:Uncharacterized protein n=1 Tax=Conoideocrella luteorostrata TaxID=1105319 RepID=A0AAJ0CEX7_9HYPO|nr:hypothetical protein QQS21_011039 [Conoideocrella luteorostrata]
MGRPIETASSIFEFLTYPNPHVTHREVGSKNNTRSQLYYLPKKVKKWNEFDNFKVLKHVFGGRLFEEALRGDRELPPYPTIDKLTDCMLKSENHTRDLIHKWNKTMVTAALGPIQYLFHPVIWYKGTAPDKKEMLPRPMHSQQKKRHQPSRKSSAAARSRKMQFLSRLNADSGSSPPVESPTKVDCLERFPKEYKPSTKWNSSSMLELIDSVSHEWDLARTSDNRAYPVKQAFTYCIKNLCRYGCILTCKEAFIFRIRPLDGKPTTGTEDTSELKKQLIDNGLLEYASVPWDNHCHGKLEEHDSWTINLALWFIHVLAGNNYEVDWEYDLLQNEDLKALTAEITTETSSAKTKLDEVGVKELSADEPSDNASSESSDSHESRESRTPNLSPAVKRKRDRAENDNYQLSFSKRPATDMRQSIWDSDN